MPIPIPPDDTPPPSGGPDDPCWDLLNLIADPTEVVCKVMKPDGTVLEFTAADAELVHDSVGTWTLQLDIDEPGLWRYRFEGTGDVVAAEEASFVVGGTSFP
jgi:hypothetical protein